MTTIVLVMFVSVVVLIVFSISMVWYMQFLVKKFIGEKHHRIEEITSSGEVPLHWAKRYDRKVQKLERHGAPVQRIKHLRQKAQRNYLSKLGQLERYMKYTNLVDSESTRKTVLSQLQNVRQQWEEQLANER